MDIAIPLIDLAAIVLAAVALALLLAGKPLFNWVAGLFGHVPVVGGPIASVLTGVYDSWITSLEETLTELARGMADMFRFLWLPLQSLWDDVRAIGQATARTIRGVVSYTIHNAVTTAEQYAASYADDIYNELNHLLSLARAYLLSYAQDIYNELNHELSLTRSYLLSYAQDIYNELARSIRRVESYAVSYAQDIYNVLDRGLADVLHYAESGIADAVRYAEHLAVLVYGEVVSGLNHATAVAIAPLWRTARQSTDTALQDIVGQFPTLRDVLHSLPESAPLTIAGALSASMAMSITAVESVDKCALPNCEEKNLLAREAHNISSLVSTGGMFAFLLAAIAEPTAMAKDSADVVEAIVTPVVDAVKAVA